jgi:hypothetical protein
MVIASGTIIQMKSIMTEGATANLASKRVCCVAMTEPSPRKIILFVKGTAQG